MQHFVFISRPAAFVSGETMRSRRDEDGRLVGFDRVSEDTGEVISAIDGYVLDHEPLDQRMKLPLSIDGIQLWRMY